MTYTDDEAELEASRAPLLEHLVELRKRLIVCVFALVVGFIAALANIARRACGRGPGLCSANGGQRCPASFKDCPHARAAA